MSSPPTSSSPPPPSSPLASSPRASSPRTSSPRASSPLASSPHASSSSSSKRKVSSPIPTSSPSPSPILSLSGDISLSPRGGGGGGRKNRSVSTALSPKLNNMSVPASPKAKLATNPLSASDKIKIAQDHNLDPLLKLLEHDDAGVGTVAQKAMDNISLTGTGVLVAPKVGFLPLIELARSKDQDIRLKAVWSIAILASNDENQIEIVRQVGWEQIMKWLKDDFVEVQCGGITLLGNLALLDENREQILQKNGVDVLMTLLEDAQDIIVKRAIVTALSNVVDSDNATEVIDDESLTYLITMLEKSEDERLLSGAIHTISNVANAEDPRFNRQIVRKCLRRVVELLDSPNDAIQKGSVMVLNGISSTAQYQNDVIKQGAVKKLADMLKNSKDAELILGIVLCVNNLAQNESNHKALIELELPQILGDISKDSEDPNIKGECTEALSAVNDGVMTTRKRGRKDRAPTNIHDNVKRIIEVLISDPRNQDKLRDSGVIPHLVTLITEDQRNDELKALALDALTMLSINNTRNQNDIAMPEKNRCLASLEIIIQNSLVPPKILVRAVRLVGALCWKNKLIQGLVSERKIINYLVAMLDSYDNNLKKATLTALACAAEDSEINKHRIASLGADRTIAKLLMKENTPDSLVAASAQAVAALSKENLATQNICSRAVESVVRLLEEAVRVPHGSPVEDHIVQEQLCAALCELGRNHKVNKSIMWKLGIRRLMIEILYNANASTYSHYNAIALLWDFAKSPKKRDSLANNPDLVRALRPLTESRDAAVKDAANRLKERLRI